MQDGHAVKLSINWPSGLACEIDAPISWTGIQLKEAIEQCNEISHRHQQLYLGRLKLEDDAILADQGISQSNACILLVCVLPVHIYVVGSGIHHLGTGDKHPCTLEVLDPSARTWTLGPSLSSCYKVHGLTVWNGKLYVLGNTNPDVFDIGTNSLSIEVFDPYNQTWTTTGSIPYRSNFKFAAGAGKIYACGGRGPRRLETSESEEEEEEGDGPNPLRATISLDSFDLSTCTQISFPGMAAERYEFGIEVLDDKVYAVGGIDVGGVGPGADGEVFDLASAAWTQLAPMSSARANFGLMAVAGKLYAFGGDNIGDILSSAEVFDPLISAWTPLPPMGVPRSWFGSPTVTASAGKLYVLGGEGSDSAGEIYDPIANVWATIPPMIQHRFGFGVAVYEGSLFAIGGKTYDEGDVSFRFLQSAEVFNADAHTWTELPSPSAEIATFKVAVLTENPLHAS